MPDLLVTCPSSRLSYPPMVTLNPLHSQTLLICMIPPLKLCGHALLVAYTQHQANSLSAGDMDRWTRKQAQPHSQHLYCTFWSPQRISLPSVATPQRFIDSVFIPLGSTFSCPQFIHASLQTVSSPSGHFSRSTPVAREGLGKLNTEFASPVLHLRRYVPALMRRNHGSEDRVL